MTKAVFNVFWYDYIKRDFSSYDVMEHFRNVYNELPKAQRPKTYDEVKHFILIEGRGQFWGRCEYEIILRRWPESGEFEKKIDIYEQIRMNFDLIVDLFYKEISK